MHTRVGGLPAEEQTAPVSSDEIGHSLLLESPILLEEAADGVGERRGLASKAEGAGRHRRLVVLNRNFSVCFFIIFVLRIVATINGSKTPSCETVGKTLPGKVSFRSFSLLHS